MIILDEEDDHQLKGASLYACTTVRAPERAAGCSDISLPDYQTSQDQHSTPPNPLNLPRRFDRRFWRSTLYALAIYIVLSVVIGVLLFVLVPRLKKKPHTYVFAPPAWNALNCKINDDATPASNSTQCNTWITSTDYSLLTSSVASMSTTFSTSGSFSIRSNITIGPNTQKIYGNLTVDMNPDPIEQHVTLTITLQSSQEELRDMTSVCLTDSGNNKGLFILVPGDLKDSDWLTFNVELLFPNQPSLNISQLVTYLPAFAQTFGDLNPYIAFGDLSIQGAASMISIESIRAQKMLVTNSLADIMGTFNISQALSLETIGASIYSNVTLVQLSTQQTTTTLSLNTGNGDIDASVVLYAPTVQPTAPQFPPYFNARAQTYNGTLKVDVSQDPSTAPVPLDLQTQSNLASTRVSLDSNYQGTFDVQSKLAQVHVTHGNANPTADPTREGRSRTYVEGPLSFDNIYGWVGWGPRPSQWDPTTQGNVQVSSSLGPAELYLA